MSTGARTEVTNAVESTACRGGLAVRPETLDRFPFVVEQIEDGQELGHDEEFVDAQGDVQQLQRTAFARGARVRPHDFAERGAVDVAAVLEVENQLRAAVAQERADGVAE